MSIFNQGPTVDDSCDFFMKDEVGKICWKKCHKYYTHITNTYKWCQLCLFCCVDRKGHRDNPSRARQTHVLNNHVLNWEKVLNNLAVVFRGFICPALLGLREIAFCAKCEKSTFGGLRNKTSRSTRGKQYLLRGMWMLVSLQVSNMKLSDYEPETAWLCEKCLESFANAERD